jgi:hypothetical protein
LKPVIMRDLGVVVRAVLEKVPLPVMIALL